MVIKRPHRDWYIGISITTAVLVGVFIYPRIHILRPGFRADDLAHHLVWRGLPSSDCGKLIDIDMFMGPSDFEKQSECVREYARITQDPRACEPLLPSKPGWSCLGVATKNRVCSVMAGADSQVRGDGLRVPLAECVTGSPEVQSHPCCRAVLIGKVRAFTSCDELKEQPEFYEECLYRLAMKNKDVETCAQITDDNLRVSCSVSTQAIKQSPSICPSCTNTVDTPEDLLDE